MTDVNYALGRFPKCEPEYLSAKELAKRWHLSPRTLANWRSAGKGPAYVLVTGNRVLYAMTEVRAFEQERIR